MMTKSDCPELLAEFTSGRTGWHLAEKRPGQWYAWRLINIYEHPYHLRLAPSWARPATDSWIAMCQTGDGEVAAEYEGTFAEVTEELGRTEKTLELVDQLRGCKTRLSAQALIENVRGDRLELLRLALDLPRGTTTATRDRIVRKTCGFALDMDAMSPRNGRW
jgi:hypothetical protein